MPPAPLPAPPQAQKQRAAGLEAALGPHLERLLTPALVIDLDAATHNIQAMIRRCGGPARWRPHVKTVKQSELIGRLLRAGVTQLKCATPLELALVLDTSEQVGVPVDVLVAYPHRAANLRELLRLRAASPQCTVRILANDPAHLRHISQVVAQCLDERRDQGALSVYLDVDLGMARTGTNPAVWAVCVDEGFGESDALVIDGLHGYDGHHKAGELALAHAAYERLLSVAELFDDPRELELITSGTHSYAFALAHEGLAAGPWRHTVSAGTVVLSDCRSHHAAQDLQLQQAAYVVSRVINHRLDRLTLDAGSKGVTPDAHGPSCRLLGYPELVPQRASEEHLPVVVGDPIELDQRLLAGQSIHAPAAGELVWLMPDHVCTTVNLYRQAVYVQGGRYAGTGTVGAASRFAWSARGERAPSTEFSS